jgi:hypothetical protein
MAANSHHACARLCSHPQFAQALWISPLPTGYCRWLLSWWPLLEQFGLTTIPLVPQCCHTRHTMTASEGKLRLTLQSCLTKLTASYKHSAPAAWWISLQQESTTTYKVHRQCGQSCNLNSISLDQLTCRGSPHLLRRILLR